MRVELKRIDDAFQFEGINEKGSIVQMDAGEEIGGKSNGVGPMQMLIMGLGGCSAIDIILILKKQKQTIDDFRITIDAERESGVEPSLWKNIDIHFRLAGSIDLGKAERAAKLSMEKYCSVAKTLEFAGAAITYKITVLPALISK